MHSVPALLRIHRYSKPANKQASKHEKAPLQLACPSFKPLASFSSSSSFSPLQGTTTIPILAACATTLLHNPSRLKPDNLVSECLILAISYTCFKLTVPT